MKAINISQYNIIKTGTEFHVPNTTEDPSFVAELLPDMERNEGAVFWLQPQNGTVEQQEACICVNGVFYALNSKFEKAIFRNVRLTRDFKNYESMVDGTRKLVIPKRLFTEKLRTSRRNVFMMKRYMLDKKQDGKDIGEKHNVEKANTLTACDNDTDLGIHQGQERGEITTVKPYSTDIPQMPHSNPTPGILVPPAPAPPDKPPPGPAPSATPKPSPGPDPKPPRQSKRNAAMCSEDTPVKEGVGKYKRKKACINVSSTFAEFTHNMTTSENLLKEPPLLHTPFTMFVMLRAAFEEQWPNLLLDSPVNKIMQNLQAHSENNKITI